MKSLQTLLYCLQIIAISLMLANLLYPIALSVYTIHFVVSCVRIGVCMLLHRLIDRISEIQYALPFFSIAHFVKQSARFLMLWSALLAIVVPAGIIYPQVMQIPYLFFMVSPFAQNVFNSCVSMLLGFILIRLSKFNKTAPNNVSMIHLFINASVYSDHCLDKKRESVFSKALFCSREQGEVKGHDSEMVRNARIAALGL